MQSTTHNKKMQQTSYYNTKWYNYFEVKMFWAASYSITVELIENNFLKQINRDVFKDML